MEDLLVNAMDRFVLIGNQIVDLITGSVEVIEMETEND